jgi:hypothetical protein
MGVLLLSTTADAPALAARSHRLRPFPGHVPLLTLTIRVPGVAAEVVAALRLLVVKVAQLADTVLQAAWIRVPLDTVRGRRESLQWRALTLSENRVSANRELLDVLVDIRGFQAITTLDTPLLVDEKVHYAISRLMYAAPFSGYDVARWLARVPLLYGVWHPYKQTLTLVYRAFFPVFALLEFTGCPALGSAVRMQRKVLYMEKVFAALLLAGHSLKRDVETALANAHSLASRHPAQCPPVVHASHPHPPRERAGTSYSSTYLHVVPDDAHMRLHRSPGEAHTVPPVGCWLVGDWGTGCGAKAPPSPIDRYRSCVDPRRLP